MRSTTPPLALFVMFLACGCSPQPHARPELVSVARLRDSPGPYQAPLVRVRGFMVTAEPGLEVPGLVGGNGVLFDSLEDAENCQTRKALMLVPQGPLAAAKQPYAAEVEVVGRFRKPKGNSPFKGIIDIAEPPVIKAGSKPFHNCATHPPPMPPEPTAVPPNNSSKPTPLRGAA